jgi:hypothetical protein
VEAALDDLGAAGGQAFETVYGDHSVKWERRMPLKTFLALPDQRFREPTRQWNYRLYLKGDKRPLYVGKTGPRAPHVKKGVRDRLADHARATGGVAISTVTTIDQAKAAAAKHRSAPKKGLQGDAEFLSNIIKSIGLDNIEVKVGEVFKRKVGPAGKVSFLPPDPLASLLTELFQRKSGVARVNRRDRAEDDVETAVEELADEYDLPGRL